MYKPSEPFNVAMYLLIPTTQTIKGVTKKVFPETGELIYGTFKTYGGTESTSNDVISIVDTANIETWYRPDIKADCGIALADSNKVYEVSGEPENIRMRNQVIKFKVQAVKGGA